MYFVISLGKWDTIKGPALEWIGVHRSRKSKSYSPWQKEIREDNVHGAHDRADQSAGEGERVLEVKEIARREGWEEGRAGDVTECHLHHVGKHVDERHLSGGGQVEGVTDNGKIDIMEKKTLCTKTRT